MKYKDRLFIANMLYMVLAQAIYFLGSDTQRDVWKSNFKETQEEFKKEAASTYYD